ncbi:hypothetical protein AAV94_03365 [Lampropedia cohaerens]|uniref:histidine kinase n=2 Tax=Lampropedia cohaerens TaxID=1610491 RepID=A0A0U1Q214_9BURK|nr:hypothetical protein AAV94_03365 [Lampropedia cohaerens]
MPGPFQRLWRGFLTGRIMIAAALLFLLGTEWLLTGAVAPRVLWLIGAYLALALLARLMLAERQPHRGPSLHWALTIGCDVALCMLLMLWHASGGLSFVPLLGLPVLMAAALGNLTVLLATVLLVLAALTGVQLWPAGLELDPQSLLQALLAGLGFLVLGLLVHQMAMRLSGEEQEGRKSRAAALLQSQVNALVISNLSDGVLVVDENMLVHSTNPAALGILGLPDARALPLDLLSNPAWRPLVAMARLTFRRRQPQLADLTLMPQGTSPLGVQARTWITEGDARLRSGQAAHCVMFLHDLRKVEAQVRTEKLASMGRMSAAVAHEIRNPLSAIIQANTLLAEDLHDPAAQRLTAMIRQNAERLRRIAEDILDVARVQRQADTPGSAEALPLDELVRDYVRDWQRAAPAQRQLQLQLRAGSTPVLFDREHLRRILVNLLDNALRYHQGQPDSLQVITEVASNGQATLTIWSDGAPIEKTVQQHLFEPFFSSESRSSGLGLFLCRELCERHGASIGYLRCPRATAANAQQAGNAFVIRFRRPITTRAPGASPLNEPVV